MARQRLVELASNRMQLMQSGPGDSREIMVLIVQTHVVDQDVQRAIVRVRLGRGQVRKGVGCFGLGSGLGLQILQLGEGLCAAVLDGREEVVLADEVACAGVEGACKEGAGDQVVDWLPGADEADEGVIEA